MRKIYKEYEKAIKENWFFNKISELNNYLSSFLKFNLAIAMLIFLIIAVNAGDVIIKNGELNITNNLLVNTNTLFVDSTNNKVGIGTSSPNSLLHVNGISNFSSDVFVSTGNISIDNNYWLNGINGLGGLQPFIRARSLGYDIGYTGIQVGQENDHIAVFIDPTKVTGGSFGGTTEIFFPEVISIRQPNSARTDWIGAMQIDNGKIFIGATATPSTMLSIAGNFSTNNDAYLAVQSGSVGIGTITPTAGIELDVEGQAECDGAGCWTVESDIALKENITNSTYGLKDVMKIIPREYDYKIKDNDTLSGTHSFGLIAQELKLIVPEVVYGEDGNMSIGYGGLTPILINAIQEQQAQIQDLKSRVASLEAR